MRILSLILFMFLFACKQNVKQEIKQQKKVTKKVKTGELLEQKNITFYEDVLILKERDSFNFMNYIDKIPKATLPILPQDYKYFLTKKTYGSNDFYKYEINRESIRGYPIFYASHFGFDTIKQAKISEIGLFNKSLSNYSVQKNKEDFSSDDFFHYIIPIFYFPIDDDIYVIGYVFSIVGRNLDFPSITIQAYDKHGRNLDSKWDYICMLYAYSTPDNNDYSLKKSSISTDYIITEKRKSNDFDSKYSNITVKYKITKEGLEIIE